MHLNRIICQDSTSTTKFNTCKKRLILYCTTLYRLLILILLGQGLEEEVQTNF